jgi:hypothetical protein
MMLLAAVLLNLPTDAVVASTRIRVNTLFESAPASFGKFNCGEVEEYSADISGGPTICSESFEPNDSKSEAAPITTETDILSQISTPKDVDWFSFSNSAAAPNIKVTLTNLPANYNLKLIDPSGVSVKTSRESGTANEVITFNTFLVGEWKVAVTGVNKSFNNTQCYTLHVSTSNVSFPFKT